MNVIKKISMATKITIDQINSSTCVGVGNIPRNVQF